MIKIFDNDYWMWWSLQKLEMTDFMEEDAKFTL